MAKHAVQARGVPKHDSATKICSKIVMHALRCPRYHLVYCYSYEIRVFTKPSKVHRIYLDFTMCSKPSTNLPAEVRLHLWTMAPYYKGYTRVPIHPAQTAGVIDPHRIPLFSEFPPSPVCCIVQTKAATAWSGRASTAILQPVSLGRCT